jgi:hypothetical protein
MHVKHAVNIAYDRADVGPTLGSCYAAAVTSAGARPTAESTKTKRFQSCMHSHEYLYKVRMLCLNIIAYSVTVAYFHEFDRIYTANLH